MYENLSENNFILYAAKNYNNPSCNGEEEFYEDLNVFKYILRIFNRYKESGSIQERLILNHIIIAYNLFGIPATTRMLFYRIKGHEDLLKTFLVYLNYMPNTIEGIDGKDYKYSDMELDSYLLKRLQAL